MGESKDVIIVSGEKKFQDVNYYLCVVSKDFGEGFSFGDKVERMMFSGRIGDFIYKVKSLDKDNAMSKCIKYCEGNGLRIVGYRFYYDFG